MATAMATATRRRRVWRRLVNGLVPAIALTIVFAPEALAFPYRATIDGNAIYSDRPIPPAIGAVLARADRLIAASAIYGPNYGHRVFLTDGGWRWRVLSIGASDAFALTRPLSEAIIVNASDVAADRVSKPGTVGTRTGLARVIAHERTHGLIRARYGLVADLRLPEWKREGYCDYVSGGTTLADREAAALIGAGQHSGALDYYGYRQRVAAVLAANGGSVDALFAS